MQWLEIRAQRIVSAGTPATRLARNIRLVSSQTYIEGSHAYSDRLRLL